MWKKIMPLIAVSLMFCFISRMPVMAATKAEKEAAYAVKVKAAIEKLGVGPDARVAVKLRDKTNLKGYVSEVSDDHFTLIDDKTNAATSVAYPLVKQVKGNNLSKGVKIAIGIGIAIYLVFALRAIYNSNG